MVLDGPPDDRIVARAVGAAMDVAEPAIDVTRQAHALGEGARELDVFQVHKDAVEERHSDGFAGAGRLVDDGGRDVGVSLRWPLKIDEVPAVQVARMHVAAGVGAGCELDAPGSVEDRPVVRERIGQEIPCIRADVHRLRRRQAIASGRPGGGHIERVGLAAARRHIERIRAALDGPGALVPHVVQVWDTRRGDVGASGPIQPRTSRVGSRHGCGHLGCVVT